MDSSDKVNVRRLCSVLEQDFNSFLDADLFQPNNSALTRSLVSSYLNNLLEREVLHDYKVEVITPTWEYYYPSMPVRLLAIEASELFGDDLIASPENIRKLQGYPYRRVDEYFVRNEVGEDEYYGNSDGTMPPEELVFIESRLVIDNPMGKIIMDLLIRPIRPLEYITVTLSAPQGCFDVA